MTVEAWHFINENHRLGYGDNRLVVVGQTLGVEPPIELCEYGLHASIRAIHALEYSAGPVICRVRLSGEIEHGDDKLCATERTVLWMADATRTLHEFALWCAENALTRERAAGREPDARSWNVIAVKRRWLDNEATDKELSVARAAAWDATRDAARAAAWAAAWAAARAAAWAAARAAAWDAARAAAWDAQEKKLDEMLWALAPAAVKASSREGQQPMTVELRYRLFVALAYWIQRDERTGISLATYIDNGIEIGMLHIDGETLAITYDDEWAGTTDNRVRLGIVE